MYFWAHALIGSRLAVASNVIDVVAVGAGDHGGGLVSRLAFGVEMTENLY